MIIVNKTNVEIHLKIFYSIYSTILVIQLSIFNVPLIEVVKTILKKMRDTEFNIN